MKHTTFSWETIRDDIPRAPESPISKLIEHVIRSEMSRYLFPATMHGDLRIGRSSNFSRADGELTVEYKTADDRVVFCYYDSETSEPWTKECRGTEIIPTFNHVVTRRLRWRKHEG
jgi:hypothetical protein